MSIKLEKETVKLSRGPEGKKDQLEVEVEYPQIEKGPDFYAKFVNYVGGEEVAQDRINLDIRNGAMQKVRASFSGSYKKKDTTPMNEAVKNAVLVGKDYVHVLPSGERGQFIQQATKAKNAMDSLASMYEALGTNLNDPNLDAETKAKLNAEFNAKLIAAFEAHKAA